MLEFIRNLGRQKPRTFIAPRTAAPLAWGVDLSYDALLKLTFQIEKITISKDDQQMLRGIREHRVLHFSNHPTFAEPAIAYHVANVMGSRFNYMASRTLFDWAGGAIGEFIRSLGAFSVLAGAADRESLKMARQVLAKNKGKLVLYPEGMNNFENDNMVPFQPGAAQIAFWGLTDALKQDAAADITVLPSFVKYIISGTPEQQRRALGMSIARLEQRLGIDPGERNLLRRFLTTGRVLMERTEAEYGIAPGQDKHQFPERVRALRHRILDQVAETIELTGYDPDDNVITKIRKLYLIVETVNAGFPDPRLAGVKKEVIQDAEKKLRLAYNFSTFDPRYLLERPTAERFYEWLNRFEKITLGKSKERSRSARLLFAPTFRLSEYWHEYGHDKRGTVEALTRRLRCDLEQLMEQAVLLTVPIVKPWDAGADLTAVYHP
ncbi:MAG: 1-acyl-sn-glycerol-3-phosphate acyltransferase [Leptospiraceae bacterium]|nr:1-acyl-sn-glycerol-3-phosphate acyltransferase [Leptospiraceae bacterium]